MDEGEIKSVNESTLEKLLICDDENIFLAEPWHTQEFLGPLEKAEYAATWRLKERMKTAGVALVLCLNLGTDPPDVIKPVPCARRECWFDPVGPSSKQKKLEIIGNALQQQYEKWQGKAKYKQCLDPSSEDLRRICINLRKTARSDRLLFHYNGHGVPLPTKNGELWLFGKHYTHYMPVATYELKAWLGEPAIYVLDCSSAGALLPHFIDSKKLQDSAMFSSDQGGAKNQEGDSDGTAQFAAAYDGEDVYGYNNGINASQINQNQSMNAIQEFYANGEGNIVVLAACRANQILPMNPRTRPMCSPRASLRPCPSPYAGSSYRPPSACAIWTRGCRRRSRARRLTARRPRANSTGYSRLSPTRSPGPLYPAPPSSAYSAKTCC